MQMLDIPTRAMSSWTASVDQAKTAIVRCRILLDRIVPLRKRYRALRNSEVVNMTARKGQGADGVGMGGPCIVTASLRINGGLRISFWHGRVIVAEEKKRLRGKLRQQDV